MAPSSSSVHIRLAEPVVFLRNLDSATDRRERRAQRRRAQQAAEALARAGDHTAHAASGHHFGNNNPLFGGSDQAYVPPPGRGGAGSRDRSSSQARARSASRGRPSASALGTNSPSRSQATLPAHLHGEATADLQRGRSPASRRDLHTAAASEPESQQQQQPPRPATPGAATHVGTVTQPAPALPLADVPIIQPENTDIGLTRPPAIIRGVMTVHFSRATRVKKIGIRLKGQSKTEWPEGLGSRRLDTAERNKLIDETVLFFDATSSSAAQSRRAASLGPANTTPVPEDLTSETAGSGSRTTTTSASTRLIGRSESMMPSMRPMHIQQASSSPSGQPIRSNGVTREEPTNNASQVLESDNGQSTVPLSETPPPIEPPEYSPATAPGMASPTDATASVADAPVSPLVGSAVAFSPISQSTRPHGTTDLPRIPPAGRIQNRAAELRTEAAAMSPPSSSPVELSPAGSRASSLYDRAITTENAVTGASTDDSRPASVVSSAEAPENLAAISSRLPQSDSPLVETPSSIETPLQHVETNASGFSVSSSSDNDHNGTFTEQRGRSSMPAQRARAREDLTHQTIREDEAHDSYFDSLHGSQAERRANTESSPRRTSFSPSRSQSTSTTASNGSTARTLSGSPTSAVPAPGSPNLGSGLASSSRRSSSATSSHVPSSHMPKPARFSFSSLIHRDKSSSRTRRSASPDSMLHSKRANSTAKTRGNSLQVIKNALVGALHDKDAHSNSTHVTHTPISSEAETDSEDEHGRGRGRTGSRSTKWQEFKAGSYHFPIYLPIPLSLPPTIHANHGQVTYMLKGFVNRAGALTPNMHTVTEVHVVAAPHEDDLEAIESIIVERMWETQLNYKIVIHCKSIPIGGQIPVSIYLNPLSKMKLYRLTAVLEERLTLYAKDRKLSRNEPIRRYDLIRIQKDDNSAMLPIISDDPDAIAHSPLKDWIADATTTEGTGIQTLDPNGPWFLGSNIPVPDCTSTLQFSTSHEKANLSVIHSLKIIMRVERGDDDYLDSRGGRKKFDIIVEAPMHILSCRTAAANALPTYTFNPSPITNPFDGHGEISVNSSAFHPHELSETERHTLHYRGHGPHSIVPHLGHHVRQPTAAEATGISDAQLQLALLQGSGGSTVDPPPPSYEYVETHRDEVCRPPLSVAV